MKNENQSGHTATIEATLYRRPHGDRKQIIVTKIKPEDAEYINANSVKVSMEDINGLTAVYFDHGAMLDDDETPDEITLIAGPDRKCEDLMSEAVSIIKRHKARGQSCPA